MARAGPPVRDDEDDDAPLAGRARLDKWLWAARFFRTRALAAEAIDGGKVSVNDDRPKRARLIAVGDVVALRIGPYEHVLQVRDVSARRGSAAVAQGLYAETPASLARRAAVSEQYRTAAMGFAHHEGKPSKKERRAIDRARPRW